jgi:hypothetical protein
VGNISQVEAFSKQWDKKVEDCDGRLKTKRYNFELQFNSLDKLS